MGNGDSEIGCVSQCAEESQWNRIRALIAECPDLTDKSRHSIIALGDTAARDRGSNCREG